MSAIWNDKEKDTLKNLWPDETSSVIARIVGKSRNAIIGMAHRMKLPRKKTVNLGGHPKKEKAEPVYVPPTLRPFVEPAPLPLPNPENSVPLLEAGYGQCRAIIGSTNDSNRLAVVCGNPIVEGRTYSFCAYHLDRYTTPRRH